MLQINSQTKIFVGLNPVDFRLGIDGLCAFIKQYFNLNPLEGAMFAFTNTRRSGIKFLIYDGQGYWFCYKRLSQGRLRWWPSGDGDVSSIDARNLLLLIYNGDPGQVKFKANWKNVQM